jgi:hypothetical protein
MHVYVQVKNWRRVLIFKRDATREQRQSIHAALVARRSRKANGVVV